MTRLVLTCTPAHYATIARTPLFLSALRLARSVNAVRACRDAMVPSSAVPDVHRPRQSRNMLLFFGATLFEALLVLDNLGPELGRLDSTKKHLAPLRHGHDWRELRDKILKPLRNQVVFHNDPGVLPRATGTLPFSVIDFATRAPTDGSEPYYELADIALIPAAFAEGSYPTVAENLLRYWNDVIVYAGYFCRAADEVLLEVATRLGFNWESTEIPPSTFL
mgnify:CR=1 FL=1